MTAPPKQFPMPFPKPFNALILAGRRHGASEPVCDYAGAPDKALIRVAGVILLRRVVTALNDAGAAQVAVVCKADGKVAQVAQEMGCAVIAQADGPSASVAKGLQALSVPLLVTTVDHALLRAEWVLDFLSRSHPDADINVLMARRSDVEGAGLPTRRTYLHLADGAWTGCNLFLLSSLRVHQALTFWQKIEQERKRPWRMAAMLGPHILTGYAMRRFTLDSLMMALSRKAGIVIRGIETPFGHAALDVDKPSDLNHARKLAAKGL